MFYKIAEPKNIIDDAGSNLIYEFRRIKEVISFTLSDTFFIAAFSLKLVAIRFTNVSNYITIF